MATPEPAAHNPPDRKQGLTLRTKFFLPLFLLIIIQTAFIFYGSRQLFNSITRQALDARLQAGGELFYHEFKEQERLLLAYAGFLQQFEVLGSHPAARDEFGILQDSLLNTLGQANIAVTFFNSSSTAPAPIAALDALFEQARRTDTVQFGYTEQLNGLPTLIVAAPLREPERGGITRILLLQTSLGEEFLTRVAKPLGLSASLHNLQGRILASGGNDPVPVTLPSHQLGQLRIGTNLVIEQPSPEGLVRHLFSLVPLGTSDLIVLAMASPVHDLAAGTSSLAVLLLLVAGFTSLLGAAIIFRAFDIVLRPAQALAEAAEALGRGNLAHRIEKITNDELGDVAQSFNRMAAQFETVCRENAERQTDLALAVQEERTRATIERKTRDLEKVSEELRAHLRELAALYQLNQNMVSAPETGLFFDHLLQVVAETFGCDQVVLFLLNTRENTLEAIRTLGMGQDTLQGVSPQLDQGVTGQTAQSLRQYYVRDVEQQTGCLAGYGQTAIRGAVVSSPLLVKGRLIGVLNLHKRTVDSFTSSELKMAQAIANQSAMAVENARLSERVHDLSNIDDLTGLANRRHFQEALKREASQARRFDLHFSIVMCEIDYFDCYRARYGQLRGNALLCQVGQILRENTRTIDLVCRFGNQEFVLLLTRTDKAGGLAAAEKLRRCILQGEFEGAAESQPGGRLTLSFGVSEFPSDSNNIYELLNQADRALYSAREGGRNRIVAWHGPSSPSA